MLRRLVDQTKVAIIVDTSLDSSPGSFVHEEDASRGLLERDEGVSLELTPAEARRVEHIKRALTTKERVQPPAHVALSINEPVAAEPPAPKRVAKKFGGLLMNAHRTGELERAVDDMEKYGTFSADAPAPSGAAPISKEFIDDLYEQAAFAPNSAAPAPSIRSCLWRQVAIRGHDICTPGNIVKRPKS